MMIGQTIGPFTIESELGSGAMGTVYKARMLKDDGRIVAVALKVVSLGLLGNEGAMARFEREAAILKQLRHPHIVRLLATGKYRQTPFIAMEYVAGESLDRTLAKRRRLAWDETASYARQLCEALQHAHEKGIVHRDLKPSNLMVTSEGKLKLTDFGIAKDTDVTALTGANSTIGTAAYMSPEQCRGDKTLGPKSDLYSLGVCLYELVTGQKPHTADNTIEMFLKHVNETPTRPRRLNAELPIWADNLIMFLLEKNKENRPVDAATVGRMIEEIEEKVRAQKSVGAEVANARRVDRPIGERPVEAADREAARSLRTAKKKKKKPARPARPPVLLAAAIVLPVLALLAAAVYLMMPAGKPVESADAKLERVLEIKAPSERLTAVDNFLRANPTGPLADRARDIARAAITDRTETALLKRYNSALRKNDEGFEPESYLVALQALNAEAAGQLSDAVGLWKKCQELCPPAPAGDARPADEDVLKISLAWVAERRVKVISTEVPALLNKLTQKLNSDRLYELDPPFDPGNPELVAIRAIRTELFPDRFKARAAWERLATLTRPEPDLLPYTLLGWQKSAQIVDKEADPAVRVERVEKRLAELTQLAEQAATSNAPEVTRREVRNGCRDILAIYTDDPSAGFAPLVVQARKLLDATVKPQ